MPRMEASGLPKKTKNISGLSPKKSPGKKMPGPFDCRTAIRLITDQLIPGVITYFANLESLSLKQRIVDGTEIGKEDRECLTGQEYLCYASDKTYNR